MYESSEYTDFEALTFVYNFENGERGITMKHDRIRAKYMRWRETNFDKIVFVEGVYPLLRAIHEISS